MKKKIFAIGLAIMLVFAMAGCGNDDQGGQTPYQMVNAAEDKLNAADSVAYNMDVEMTITVPGEENAEESISMKMTGDARQEKVGENLYNLAYNMTTDMSSMGLGSVDMEMYYTDGYMYYNTPAYEQKYKVPMDMETALKEANSSALEDITEDMILESSATAEGDGQVVNMLLDGTKMTDVVTDMMGDMSGFVSGTEAPNITIANVPYVVHLDADGNLTSLNTVVEMTLNIEGQEMKMGMNLTMDVTAVGNVPVDLPDDLADYPEMDDMLELDGADAADADADVPAEQ